MPPGIDQSITGTSVGDVLGAARHLADILVRLQHRLGSNERYELLTASGVRRRSPCSPSSQLSPFLIGFRSYISTIAGGSKKVDLQRESVHIDVIETSVQADLA